MCNLSRLKTVVTGEKKILGEKKGSKSLFSMGYPLSSIIERRVRPAVKVLRPHQQALCHQGAAEITVQMRMRMGLPPQTARLGLPKGDPGIISLPSLLPAVG